MQIPLQMLPPQKPGAPLSGAVTALPPMIYQPYLTAEQRARLSPLATALDISFNTGASTREYELFRYLFDKHTAAGDDQNRFTGLLSSKFESKSAISLAAFLEEAGLAQQQGYDCFLSNPMIGSAAVHSHVWEQGIASGHAGLDVIFRFLHERNYPVSSIQGYDSFSCCNYVCGNRKFWAGYFSFVETILKLLALEEAKGSEAGRTFAGGGNNHRDGGAGMRVFVIERLLGTYLQVAPVTSGLRIAAHRATPGEFELKFGARIGALLHGLYVMKCRAVEHADLGGVENWLRERKAIARNPLLLWNLDDPPDWAPSFHVPAAVQPASAAAH